MSRLERILGFSATISGWIGQWAVLAMVLLIVIGVTFRYVLNLPLAFDAEYTGYLLAVISLVGAAYALKAGSHVRVDILLRSLPPRIQNWLQVITDIISIACIGLLLYHSWNLAYSNLVRGVTSVTPMETPLGLIQMILPLGWTFFLLQLFIEFSRSLRAARLPRGEVENLIAAQEGKG